MTEYYIRYKHGHGNRVLFLIIVVYLHYKTGKKINIIKDNKPIEHKGTENTINLFPNIKKIIKFVEWEDESFYYIYKMVNNRKRSIDQIFDIKHKNILICDHNFTNCLYIAFYIYSELLPKTIQDKYFNINKSMISTEAKNKAKNTPFAVIHIRYGDKLDIVWNDKYISSRRYYYILAKPDFYIDYIKKILNETNMPIYILTDSMNITKNLIYNLLMKDQVLKDQIINRVQLLDYNLFDSYYMLLNAVIIIATQSTFSATAMLLSKKNRINYVYTMKNDIITENRIMELLSNYRNINYVYDKKYLLNNDYGMIKTLLTTKLSQ